MLLPVAARVKVASVFVSFQQRDELCLLLQQRIPVQLIEERVVLQLHRTPSASTVDGVLQYTTRNKKGRVSGKTGGPHLDVEQFGHFWPASAITDSLFDKIDSWESSKINLVKKKLDKI